VICRGKDRQDDAAPSTDKQKERQACTQEKCDRTENENAKRADWSENSRAIGRRNSSPRLLDFRAPASIWFTRRRQFGLARRQTTARLRIGAAVVFVLQRRSATVARIATKCGACFDFAQHRRRAQLQLLKRVQLRNASPRLFQKPSSKPYSDLAELSTSQRKQAVNASRMRRRSATSSSKINICFGGFSLTNPGLRQTARCFKFLTHADDFLHPWKM
jgi:hypothetical protein